MPYIVKYDIQRLHYHQPGPNYRSFNDLISHFQDIVHFIYSCRQNGRCQPFSMAKNNFVIALFAIPDQSTILCREICHQFCYFNYGDNKPLFRERPFDFQGGGGFGQAGIFFLHVFRDRIFFFSTIEGWNFFFSNV